MSPSSQRIRFCKSRDGTRIAYATCGSGPPLVRAAHWISHLKHDWDSPVWRPLLSLLSRRHTLIRYDPRGCGLSDRDDVPFSFDKFIEDLEAVIEAVGIDRFVLYGSTAAGATAMAYAARHAERVSHLVVTGCYSTGRLAPNRTPREIEETELHMKAIELGWANENPAFRQFFTSLFIPDATPEQACSLNELMRLAMSPVAAANRLRVFHRLDLREIAQKVRCPTLVLHSRQDARVPFEEGRALAALIPNARFVPIESRNHWILENEPAWQQFVDELDDFLPATKSLEAGLTPREFDVLELVAQGHENAKVASRLGISEKTVRNRMTVIMSKLGVRSRGQAIIYARDAGIGKAGAG